MKLRFDIRAGLALIVRFILFALLWWVITEGAMDSWSMGAAAALLAAIVSVALLPPTTINWFELLRFVPFFILRSLSGGIDVAKRALHPKLPIAPALVDYPLRLPTGLPRVIMINTMALLPGTLSVDITGDHLTVHVLDGRINHLAEFKTVEYRVARLFALSLPLSGGGN